MDTGIGSLYLFSDSTSPTNGSLLQDSNMSIQIESSASGSSLNQFMQTVKENISANNNNNSNSKDNSTSHLLANIQQQNSAQSYGKLIFLVKKCEEILLNVFAHKPCKTNTMKALCKPHFTSQI